MCGEVPHPHHRRRAGPHGRRRRRVALADRRTRIDRRCAGRCARDADRGARRRHRDEGRRSTTTSWSRPGAVLVEIDPRDYQVAVDKARAELADAEAAAIAAQSNVPITSTTAAEQRHDGARRRRRRRRAASTAAERELDAARARLVDRAGARCARPKPTPPKRRATSSGCAACSPRTKSRSSSSTRRSRPPTRRRRRSTRRGRRSPKPKPAFASPRAKLMQARAGEQQAQRRAADGADRRRSRSRRPRRARRRRRRASQQARGDARAGRAEPAVRDRQGAGARHRLEEERRIPARSCSRASR